MNQALSRDGAHTKLADSVIQVRAGELDVGVADIGPVDAPAVLLLHGWPYSIDSFAETAQLLVAAGRRVLAPHLRGHGTTRLREASAPRNAQQSVFAADALALLDALDIPDVTVAGFDWGARTANILAALHPGRVRGHVAVSGYLIGSPEANAHPLPPSAEHAWWYQFYFATERGVQGYEQNRSEFARLIWRTASPRWRFDDETFARSAGWLDNPDHVDIVIHNYRWRLGLAQGDDRFADTERRLALAPTIAVPTITLEGDANGAPHPDAGAYASMFTSGYEHRLVQGGIGHNLPQEAPSAFAQAISDVEGMRR